jgi:hypothetical protein
MHPRRKHLVGTATGELGELRLEVHVVGGARSASVLCSGRSIMPSENGSSKMWPKFFRVLTCAAAAIFGSAATFFGPLE